MTETIAQRLKRLLKEARASGMKVSAKSLSVSLGGGETYVGDIIRGRVKNPSMAKLAKIAKLLRVPLEQLIPDDDLDAPSNSYLELRETVETFRDAARAERADLPILDPDVLAIILAALPHALTRIKRQLSADRISDVIYRAHGWMSDETAAGRRPAPDAMVNFLSHIL